MKISTWKEVERQTYVTSQLPTEQQWPLCRGFRKKQKLTL